MTGVFVDTGALLGLLDPRDQFHGSASRLLIRIRERGLAVHGSIMILAELHGLVLRRVGVPEAAQVVRAMMDDALFHWHDVPLALAMEAAGWLARFKDQRLTLTDAISFEIMRREGIATAFTFDHHFTLAGFTLFA